MGNERMWDSLIQFYEYMIDNAEPYLTDSDEILELKEFEREACQLMINLVSQLRVLPDFQNVRPGRKMHLLSLRPNDIETRAYVSRSRRGYFAVSLGDIDGVDIPDSLRWIPESEIVNELKTLMLTLH